jgi:YidC/Oxa1 family membrane protein insertase
VADYGLLTGAGAPVVLRCCSSCTACWATGAGPSSFTTLLLKLRVLSAGRDQRQVDGRACAPCGPRIKNLQDTYKDDKQKLGHAMMELYKREKINPAAGCLPMLIQMPVFFAFYWVLLESVEMRQAPFMLWVHDLSSQATRCLHPAAASMPLAPCSSSTACSPSLPMNCRPRCS